MHTSSSQTTPSEMSSEDVNAKVAEMVKDAPALPAGVNPKNLLSPGNFPNVPRRVYKERLQLIRSLTQHENNRYCRKRCPFFKPQCCWHKTYEDQRKCELEKGYEKYAKEENK